MMENRNGRDRNNNNEVAAATATAVLPNGVILRKLKSKRDESGACLLCWKAARNPTCLCPKCAKQYCFQCIKKWLTDSKTKTSECPNCKSKLPIDDLVRCAADLVVDGDDRRVEDTRQARDNSSDNGTNVTECDGSVQQNRRNGVESGSIKLVVKVIESDSSLDGRLTNGNAADEPMVNGSAQAKMLTVNGRQGKKSKEANRKQQLNHTVTSNGKVPSSNSAPLSNGIVHNGKEDIHNARVNEIDTNEQTNKRNNGKDHSTNPQRKNGFKKPPVPTTTTTTTDKVPETVVQNDIKPAETPLENGHSIVKDTTPSQQNGSNQDIDQTLCSLHALPLVFFCLTCKCCICETCGIRDSSHAEHVFQKITAIYDDKVGKIKQEFALVSTYLEEIQQVIQSVEHNIDWVKAAKARKLQELSRLLHSEAECIERQINKKLCVLQDQRDTIANEVFRVTAAYKKLESELNSCPQEELLVKDGEFLKRCSQLIEKPASSFVHQPVPADLEW